MEGEFHHLQATGLATCGAYQWFLSAFVLHPLLMFKHPHNTSFLPIILLHFVLQKAEKKMTDSIERHIKLKNFGPKCFASSRVSYIPPSRVHITAYKLGKYIMKL